jgi:hypothetical protein
VVTDVAGDHVSKSQESAGGDFGAPHCSLSLTIADQWSSDLLAEKHVSTETFYPKIRIAFISSPKFLVVLLEHLYLA